VCGVVGKVNWQEGCDQNLIAKMCKAILHRGPDDGGIITFENAVLGHRRLSIIDLSKNASQPMASNDRRYHIVYNGEVYNFMEIRKELEEAGLKFKSNSDTEVVLYSYIHWKERCLEKFQGMFAFAIWDNVLKELFLARDYFGKKPLYYFRDENGAIIFASELAALLEDKSIPQDISFEALNCYLALGYILAPATLYKNILKLEAATFLHITDKGRKVRKCKYWDYKDAFLEKTNESEKDIIQHILFLFEAAVKRRLVSDVPVGAFLSGGVDSTSVVSIMKKYMPELLHTFSIGFDVESYDESADALRAAKWLGTEHHSQICKKEDNLLFMLEAIRAYDEPFSDTSLVPFFEVCKLASSYVKVVLSGDGADEIFAGYITYKADLYYRYAQLLPRNARSALMRMPGYFCGNKIKKLDWRYKQRKFFYGSLCDSENAHYSWRVIFSPEKRIQILGKEYASLVYDSDPFNIFKKYYRNAEGLHGLDKNLYVDAMTWLSDDILVKVDRASMRSSIEIRCPYLDKDLITYAASIPAGLKMKNFKNKYILKKALKSVLPSYVLDKKKSGFIAPVHAWIGSDNVDEFQAFNKYVFYQKMKGNYFLNGCAA